MPVEYKQQLGQHTTSFEALGAEDLTGRIAIVTGGNRGIGYETARALAYAGATVYIGCRSVKSGEEAKKEILRSDDIKGTIAVIELDLTDFSSIKKFAEKYRSHEKHLHYLILNAGIEIGQKLYTQHNFEKHFGVNHMGHFYLQSLLIDIMEKQDFQSRIVIVSSEGCSFVSGLPFDDLNFRKRMFTPIFAYAQSKLCNVYLALELVRRLKGSKILVYSLHPGAVDTDMFNMPAIVGIKVLDQYIFAPLFKFLTHVVMGQIRKSTVQGASTTIYACCAKELENHSGSYLSDCKIQVAKPQFEKIEEQKKLWEVSEKYVEEVLKKGKISF